MDCKHAAAAPVQARDGVNQVGQGEQEGRVCEQHRANPHHQQQAPARLRLHPRHHRVQKLHHVFRGQTLHGLIHELLVRVAQTLAMGSAEIGICEAQPPRGGWCRCCAAPAPSCWTTSRLGAPFLSSPRPGRCRATSAVLGSALAVTCTCSAGIWQAFSASDGSSCAAVLLARLMAWLVSACPITLTGAAAAV